MFNAAQALKDEPVEFWIGRCRSWFRSHSGVSRTYRGFGKVAATRQSTFIGAPKSLLCQRLSDGFAITQLEAQAHRLPLIASSYCGDVVEHNVNGLLLNDSSVEAIASALRFCLQNPDAPARFSSAASVGENYSISRLGKPLCGLARITESATS